MAFVGTTILQPYVEDFLFWSRLAQKAILDRDDEKCRISSIDVKSTGSFMARGAVRSSSRQVARPRAQCAIVRPVYLDIRFPGGGIEQSSRSRAALISKG